jgi:hypothetical protein
VPGLAQQAGELFQMAGPVGEDQAVDLAGAIGRHILGNLLPDRRLRVSPRAVKRPLSRYAYKSLRVDRRTYKATISIDILPVAQSLTTWPCCATCAERSCY